MARSIGRILEFDWARNGVWVNESDRLISASGSWSYSPPNQSFVTSRGHIAQMQVVLDNHDARFSPLNTSSPLVNGTVASNGLGGGYGVPVRLKISINGGNSWEWVFHGVAKIPRESGPTTKDTATVSFDCRGREEQILNRRVSTTLANFQQNVFGQATEDELIRKALLAAGLIDGVDFISPYYYDNVSSVNAPTLDRGRFVIPFFWLDDESPIEEIWGLVAACGGRFYAGPDGRFYYEAIDHWLNAPHTIAQETFGARGSQSSENSQYTDLNAQYDDDNFWSEIVVEASPREIDTPQLIWQPDEVYTIPPGSSKTVLAQLRQAAHDIFAATFTATTPGGIEITSDITLTQTNYAQRVDLQFANGHATQAALIRQLSISGSPLVGGPSVEERAKSTDNFWSSREPRTRSIRGSIYTQSRDHAQLMAEYLRDRLERPALTYSLRGVPGVPTRRLGDYVAILDPDVMPGNVRHAFVISLRWRLSSSGFVQDLTAVDAANVFKHAPDDYFIIGTDVCGASTLNARIFY